MNKFQKILYRFIYPSALIFTVLSTVFYVVSNRLSEDEATRQYALLMLFVLVYSMVLSAFTLVFRTKKSAVAKTLIHFALILASLAFILFVITDAFSPLSSLIILGVFTGVYWIIAVPSLIVYNRKKAKENEKQEYKSRFSGKK